MYIFSHLAEYLAVLLITTDIFGVYCQNFEEATNSDLFPEENTRFNLNKFNSSFNTIQNFQPEVDRLGFLTEDERYLNEGNKKDIIASSYFDHTCKRNAYNHDRIRRRKQSKKYKDPNKVSIQRPYTVRKKSKAGQSLIKLNNIKKFENQETSLYETNENPFKVNESRVDTAKYGAEISYKNSKTSLKSNKHSPSRFVLFDKNKEGDKNDCFKGTNVINEQTDNESQSSGYSEDNIEKGYKKKLKRKHPIRQTGIQGESENPDRKPHTSNILKVKQNVQQLSKRVSLSPKSGTKFENRKPTETDDLSILSLLKESRIQELVPRSTQNVSSSDSDEIDDGTNSDGVDRTNERDNLNDNISEMGDVLKTKDYLNKEISDNGFNEKSSSKGKNYKKSEKENTDTSLFEHANSKRTHNYTRNYHEKNGIHKQNPVKIRNIYDLKHMKQKEKASIVTSNTQTSDAEREYYESSIRDKSIRDSNSNQKGKDIKNKRNQRDIKKRLSKHSKYKNHHQDGYVFGYQKDSDESEDLNLREAQKGQDNYNMKDSGNSELHEPFDISSNNNDKYSYKESLEGENEGLSDEENTKIKFNRKKAFSRQSHDPKQKEVSKEKCVEYKAEKVTKKPMCGNVSTTERCTTKGTTYAAIKRTTDVKTKTTPETCNKPLTTKYIENELGTNNRNSETFDIFEKYLSGQLADEFVDIVMEKVKRSRKIYKELGFRNDSEETCDRCIETKPNKMPDKETMKMSLGKCLKSNGQKPGCSMCYIVPRPMEQVLNILVSFEKAHENSVYNKILDDSSFIFTGDYPEQFVKNDDSGSNNKYNSDRNSLSKETFDKQDLREDSNEEKQDDQVVKGALNSEYSTLEGEVEHEEYSTETGVNQNDNLEQEYDTKSNVQQGMRRRDFNYKNKGKSSLAQVDEVEANDFDDEFDNVEPKSKYSSLNEPNIDRQEDSFDKGSTKQRRKAFKSDKFLRQKNTYINPKDPENKAASKMKHHNLGERNYGLIENDPTMGGFEYEKLHKIPKDLADISVYTNVKEHHKNPYPNKGSANYKLSSYRNLANEQFNQNHNHLTYPSEDYNDETKLLHSKNNGHSVANDFMSAGWDSDEYELIPKQSGREALERNKMLYSVPRKIYYHDNEESVNMVKRESEPSYDDEPLFLEIPNIEYDLY